MLAFGGNAAEPLFWDSARSFSILACLLRNAVTRRSQSQTFLVNVTSPSRSWIISVEVLDLRTGILVAAKLFKSNNQVVGRAIGLIGLGILSSVSRETSSLHPRSFRRCTAHYLRSTVCELRSSLLSTGHSRLRMPGEYARCENQTQYP
jgi:hypothetical protein